MGGGAGANILGRRGGSPVLKLWGEESARPDNKYGGWGLFFVPLALPGGDNHRQLWPHGSFQSRQQIWGCGDNREYFVVTYDDICPVTLCYQPHKRAEPWSYVSSLGYEPLRARMGGRRPIARPLHRHGCPVSSGHFPRPPLPQAFESLPDTRYGGGSLYLPG